MYFKIDYFNAFFLIFLHGRNTHRLKMIKLEEEGRVWFDFYFLCQVSPFLSIKHIILAAGCWLGRSLAPCQITQWTENRTEQWQWQLFSIVDKVQIEAAIPDRRMFIYRTKAPSPFMIIHDNYFCRLTLTGWGVFDTSKLFSLILHLIWVSCHFKLMNN